MRDFLKKINEVYKSINYSQMLKLCDMWVRIIVAVFFNVFLLEDTVCDEFNGVMNKIQCNNRLV